MLYSRIDHPSLPPSLPSLGVHAIFGAFLFGLAMPRGHPFTLKISERK